MYEGGYVCAEIALQIPPSPHRHDPSSFDTKRRDSEEQAVISKDPPPKFRCVVTASGGDGCFFLCIRSLGSVCRNSIVRILAGQTDAR
jgi:hypothetical protein